MIHTQIPAIKKIFLSIAVILFFAACGSEEGTENTALDTGRGFIRASLDGKFEKAESLILNDGQNGQLFSRYKTHYKNLPEAEKKSYRESSYEIKKYTDVNDSVALINYSNSFMNKPMDIKIVKSNGRWKVDFKYTYGSETVMPAAQE